MAKREGMGSYRDFFRGQIVSDLARGVPPQIIVSKMLSIARNEKDPSALKAAGFQLLDKVGRQPGVGKSTYMQVLNTVATVFSGLPEPARKNFQKLASEISNIHSFGPVSMEKLVSRVRVEGPALNFVPDQKGASSAIEAATRNLGRVHTHRAAESDIGTFFAAKDAIFKVQEATRDPTFLERSALQMEFSREPPPQARPPEIMKDVSALKPELQLSAAPAPEPVTQELPKTELPSAPFMSFSRSVEAKPDTTPPKATNTNVGESATKDSYSPETRKRGDSMLMDIIRSEEKPDVPSGKEDKPDDGFLGGSDSSAIKAFMASDKGKELIARLMQKMEAHGRAPEGEELERAVEEEEADKAEKAKKSKEAGKKSTKAKKPKARKKPAKKKPAKKSKKKATKVKPKPAKKKAVKSKKAKPAKAKKAKPSVKAKAKARTKKSASKKSAKKPAKKPVKKSSRKKKQEKAVKALLTKKKKRK